jgi:hypothetical protein
LDPYSKMKCFHILTLIVVKMVFPFVSSHHGDVTNSFDGDFNSMRMLHETVKGNLANQDDGLKCKWIIALEKDI